MGGFSLAGSAGGGGPAKKSDTSKCKKMMAGDGGRPSTIDHCIMTMTCRQYIQYSQRSLTSRSLHHYK